MLDVYEFKEGMFEIVDTDHQEIRSKRVQYYKLLRFLIIILLILILTILLTTIITKNPLFLLVIIIPSGFIYFALKNQQRLQQNLKPEIGTILLEFDKHKSLTGFSIRKWMENKIDEFSEEEIRFNQAVGYKIIWFDSGRIDVELIVDVEFPGTLVFTTYDFNFIVELKKLLDFATPKLETWVYRLEDGSNWSTEQFEEFEAEVLSARIPWNIREYFTEL